MSITARNLSSDDAPQVYVACLAAYNNGILHGRWIDCTHGENHIWDEINDILETSPENKPGYPCEEWAIHDTMNFPDGLVSEYSGVSQVASFAEMFNEPDGWAILEIHQYMGFDDFEKSKEFHDEAFRGEWDSFQEFSDQYLEDCGLMSEMPDFAQRYFDYQAFARDLEQDFIVLEGERPRSVFVWDAHV